MQLKSSSFDWVVSWSLISAILVGEMKIFDTVLIEDVARSSRLWWRLKMERKATEKKLIQNYKHQWNLKIPTTAFRWIDEESMSSCHRLPTLRDYICWRVSSHYEAVGCAVHSWMGNSGFHLINKLGSYLFVHLEGASRWSIWMSYPDVPPGCCSFVHLESASRWNIRMQMCSFVLFLNLHLHPDAFDDKMVKMDMTFNLTTRFWHAL